MVVVCGSSRRGAQAADGLEGVHAIKYVSDLFERYP